MIYLDMIESFCFSFFLLNFFRIKKRYEYILITMSIEFLLMQIGNMMENNGIWLTLSILFIMINSLIIYHKKIDFNYFYIPILYNLVIFITCYLGIFLTLIIRKLTDILNIYLNFNDFLLSSYFSKLFLIIATFLMIKISKSFTVSFEFRKWNYLILFFIVLVSNIGIISYSIFLNKININVLYITLMLLVILVFLFIATLYNIHKLNKNKIEYEKMQQLKRFNEEKYKLIKNMKYDIESREHRLFYILMKIKNDAKRNNYIEILKEIDRELELSNVKQNLIDTNNSVFDYALNSRIGELKSNGIDISICAFISKNIFYDDLQVINFLCQIIDIFSKCNILKININETNDSVIIKLSYLEGNVNEKTIIEVLDDKLVDFKYIYLFEHQDINCLSVRIFFGGYYD